MSEYIYIPDGFLKLTLKQKQEYFLKLQTMVNNGIEEESNDPLVAYLLKITKEKNNL